MNTILEEQLKSLQDAFKDAQSQKSEAERSLISISNLLKGVMANG